LQCRARRALAKHQALGLAEDEHIYRFSSAASVRRHADLQARGPPPQGPLHCLAVSSWNAGALRSHDTEFCRAGAFHILIAQEWQLPGDDAAEAEDNSTRAMLVDSAGFVLVTGRGHTMIAVRKHLYESATVVLDKHTKKYEAMFVEVRFQVPILGQRSMVIGSAHFQNREAKKAMATEWTRELCMEALAVNCQILGGDWNRMHSRMSQVLSTLQKQCISIETPAQQEDVVGIVVWPGPLLTAHVVAKYFSYYN